MGYQSGLDGLRAVSVIAVILYHAGFGWMHGGFFGVEVFFVVSGYLITSLLLEEREAERSIYAPVLASPGAGVCCRPCCPCCSPSPCGPDFRVRPNSNQRCAGTFPGRCSMSATGVRSLVKRRISHRSDPPLLRHLWSLAVEEQWYLLWPLAFVAVFALGRGGLRIRGALIVGCAAAAMAFTFWLHSRTSDPAVISVLGRQANRTNFLYLSTITRSSGLLLGAGSRLCLAAVASGSRWAPAGRLLDPLGAAAVAGSGLHHGASPC